MLAVAEHPGSEKILTERRHDKDGWCAAESELLDSSPRVRSGIATGQGFEQVVPEAERAAKALLPDLFVHAVEVSSASKRRQA